MKFLDSSAEGSKTGVIQAISGNLAIFAGVWNWWRIETAQADREGHFYAGFFFLGVVNAPVCSTAG